MVEKREIVPDPKYNDRLLAKFISCLMVSGKKSVAESTFYRSLNVIAQRSKDDPVKVFKKAVENVKPLLEVRSRRVGGSTYQVPVEVRADRRQTLAIRWIISFAKKRGEKTMSLKLASEILEASQGKGSSIKKKEDLHKMAEANKAFAHYRW
jgi:small subunit ribosomal protein S7